MARRRDRHPRRVRRLMSEVTVNGLVSMLVQLQEQGLGNVRVALSQDPEGNGFRFVQGGRQQLGKRTRASHRRVKARAEAPRGRSRRRALAVGAVLLQHRGGRG